MKMYVNEDLSVEVGDDMSVRFSLNSSEFMVFYCLLSFWGLVMLLYRVWNLILIQNDEVVCGVEE